MFIVELAAAIIILNFIYSFVRGCIIGWQSDKGL